MPPFTDPDVGEIVFRLSGTVAAVAAEKSTNPKFKMLIIGFCVPATI